MTSAKIEVRPDGKVILKIEKIKKIVIGKGKA